MSKLILKKALALLLAAIFLCTALVSCQNAEALAETIERQSELGSDTDAATEALETEVAKQTDGVTNDGNNNNNNNDNNDNNDSNDNNDRRNSTC